MFNTRINSNNNLIFPTYGLQTFVIWRPCPIQQFHVEFVTYKVSLKRLFSECFSVLKAVKFHE